MRTLQYTAGCLTHEMVLGMIEGEIEDACEAYCKGDQQMVLKELADASIIIEHYLKDHDTTVGKVIDEYEKKHSKK